MYILGKRQRHEKPVFGDLSGDVCCWFAPPSDRRSARRCGPGNSTTATPGSLPPRSTGSSGTSLPSPASRGEIKALIVPHAGYVYSGQTAAYAYSLVKGKPYDTVVIIGPSHRFGFKGCSIYPKGGFPDAAGNGGGGRGAGRGAHEGIGLHVCPRGPRGGALRGGPGPLRSNRRFPERRSFPS